MSAIDLAIEMLKRHEGFRSTVYFDTATPPRATIGFGRNITDKGVTQPEAATLLRNDVLEAVAALSSLPAWVSLTESRQAVLIDLYVNLGYKGLMGFKKMFAALDAGFWNLAADELLDSKAARDLPGRYLELANLLRTG